MSGEARERRAGDGAGGATGSALPPEVRSGNLPEAKSPADVPPQGGRIPPEVCRECLAAMTHRLVQPLTALRGGLELGLLGKPSEAEYRALLQQSLELTDALSQLVVSLRDIGESGVSTGAAQSVSLEASVQQALAEVAAWAQSRDVTLKVNVEATVMIRANSVRLSEALQSLLGWAIQNTAGGATIVVDLSTSEGEAVLSLSPPKMDWQYLQIKVLEEIATPGVLFSFAAKNGSLGWAINMRLVEGLGGKLEILTPEGEPGRIRARFPIAPPS